MSPLNTLANSFQFSGLDVKTAIDLNIRVWFCAKDVCTIVDIAWSSNTLADIPENWLWGGNSRPLKNEKDNYFINEAGLYYLIFSSNKPKAKEFANWIYDIVLPEIRQPGFSNTLEIKYKTRDIVERMDDNLRSLQALGNLCAGCNELGSVITSEIAYLLRLIIDSQSTEVKALYQIAYNKSEADHD